MSATIAATAPVTRKATSKTAVVSPQAVKPAGKKAAAAKPAGKKAPKAVVAKKVVVAKKAPVEKKAKKVATAPDAAAPDATKPAVVKRAVAIPMSPRTIHNKLKKPTPATETSPAGPASELTYKDVRVCADSLARNFSRILQISNRISKTGTCTMNNRTYEKADLDEMRKAYTASIRSLPANACSTKRRTPQPISAEERTLRIEGQTARTNAGIECLTKTIKVPALSGYLAKHALNRLESTETPSKVESGAQISAAFLISDPLRNFIREANLGNGIALLFPGMSEETRSISGAHDADAAINAVREELGGKDPLEILGVTKEQAVKLADPRQILAPLLIERGIATSPLLMSIMACYISANGLRDETGRITIDDNIRKHLGNGTTRWVNKKIDYTPAEGASEDLELSGIARLQARPVKAKETAPPCDETTFVRSMSIALASHYRIPTANIPADKVETLLKDPIVADLASGIKAYLAAGNVVPVKKAHVVATA